MARIAAMLPTGGADEDVHRGARRESQRYPLHADIELLEPLSSYGIVINASAGGMRIALDQPLDLGSICMARIVTAPGKELFEKARVVWTRELPDGWVVGLEFVRMS